MNNIPVTFIQGTSEAITAIEKEAGQLLIATDTKEMFIVPVNETNAIKIGISQEDLDAAIGSALVGEY